MSHKRRHNLRPNRRQSFPRHVIFYDNESTQKEVNLKPTERLHSALQHELFFGVGQYVDYGSKNVEEEIVYKNHWEFWDFVQRHTISNRTLYIFAHNQDFDFRLTQGFSNLQRLGFYSYKHILEYPRCIATFGTQEKINGRIVPPPAGQKPPPRKYITCLDTLNYFRESLAEIGDRLNFPKLEFPGYEADWETWLTYCRQDVLITRKVFEEYVDFLKRYNLGTFAPTIASQALNAFKTRFLQHPIEIHTHEPATEIERSAYFGGRTECFYIGKLPCQHYYKLDVNSMYPFVMQQNLFPTKLLGITQCEFPEQTKKFRSEQLCIAEVELTTELNAFPLRDKGKLLFPIGTFKTALCAPELDLLDSMGCTYRLLRMAVYEGAKIFESFVSELYKLRLSFREQKNEQYQYFCKILQNSLYGKFGQKNENWEYTGNDGSMESGRFELLDSETGEMLQLKKVMGETFRLTGEEEGFDSFTAISAFVTSYARVLLWRFLTIAGRNHVYYMDTDSLLVDKTGMIRLQKHLNAKELGALKIEAFDTEGKIYNLKDYQFGGEIHIKGVSHKAKKIDHNRYLVDVWEHFQGAVIANRVEAVITKQVEKIMQRTYEKGVILPNGRTKPFRY